MDRGSVRPRGQAEAEKCRTTRLTRGSCSQNGDGLAASEDELTVAGGERGERIGECGLHRHTAPCLKQMAAQDLAQRHGQPGAEGSVGRMHAGAVWRSPLAVHLKLPQHC